MRLYKIACILFVLFSMSNIAYTTDFDVLINNRLQKSGRAEQVELEKQIELKKQKELEKQDAKSSTMDNDVNLKLGITFLNSGAEYTTEGVSDGNDKSFGTDIKLSGEYMYKVNNIFKMGIGLQIWHLAVNYTFSSGHNTNRSRTFMPLYASIQANPFNANKEFFLRGNLGYSVVYDNNYGDNEKGGMYYGISIGYEFKSGFIFEFAYEIYAYSYERLVMWDTTQDIDEYLGTTGINIGYKFKL